MTDIASMDMETFFPSSDFSSILTIEEPKGPLLLHSPKQITSSLPNCIPSASTKSLASATPISPAQVLYFETPGKKREEIHIQGINGMLNHTEDAKSHAEYLSQFTQGYSVGWVYNRTHGPRYDLYEVFFLNHFGFSPKTAKKLREGWVEFHEKNKNNPEAKLLQFAHSQGALHTKNALKNCPDEVRDRLIIVSIAPAAPIPIDSCHRVYNYTSQRDPIALGSQVFAGINSPKKFFNSSNEMISLSPHPQASMIDHSFQSPTFRKVIETHIKEYLEESEASIQSKEEKNNE